MAVFTGKPSSTSGFYRQPRTSNRRHPIPRNPSSTGCHQKYTQSRWIFCATYLCLCRLWSLDIIVAFENLIPGPAGTGGRMQVRPSLGCRFRLRPRDPKNP